MTDTAYRYTKEEAAAHRDRALREQVLPAVEEGFARHPELVSATLLVAQYWNDEANDAVHAVLVFSTRDTPGTDALPVEFPYAPDPANLPAGIDPADLPYPAGLDSNDEAIPLFAAFTREDCHQEMTIAEAYTPYAVFRRRGPRVDIEVVGKMLRPWLDGVQPEWEREGK